MDHIENYMNRDKGSSTETQKNVLIHKGLWRREFLKLLLTYLYCTKYNKINICYSSYKSILPMKNDINIINILHIGSHKSFLTHYSLWRNF